MEENMMQSEETAAMDAIALSDFEAGFADEGETGEEEIGGEETIDTPDEKPAEETQAEEKEDADSAALDVDGKKYTSEDVKALLERQPEFPETLKALAHRAGMSVQEYLQAVEDASEKQKMDARISQLLEQGMEESLAQYVADVERQNERLRAEQKAGSEREKSRAEFQKHIEEFDRLYPDVKELPPEVTDDITKTGATPVAAYQRYLIRKQEKELKMLRQEKKNRETTPGNVNGRSDVVTDPFLLEFMKD